MIELFFIIVNIIALAFAIVLVGFMVVCALLALVWFCSVLYVQYWEWKHRQ